MKQAVKLKFLSCFALTVIIAFCIYWKAPREATAGQIQKRAGVPIFEVDPFWPKINGNWIFGSIGGIAIDPTNDHVWVLQRPGTLGGRRELCCAKPASSRLLCPCAASYGVRLAGNLVRTWGGPGPEYDWPEREHGLTIDYGGTSGLEGLGGERQPSPKI